MNIAVEISYYPLSEDFITPIDAFIEKINQDKISVETGAMSTLLSGEYEDVMGILSEAMQDLMSRYPSVFNIKVTNACQVMPGNRDVD